MSDLLEAFQRPAADALSGRVRRDQVGKLGFQVLQLLVELVVFQIGDRRLGQHIITVIVLANLLTQAGDSLLGFGLGHRGNRT